MNESLFQQVVALTRDRFPAFANAPVSIEPLEKGGSDRKFYRLRVEGHGTLIFVQYGQQREENRHYVEIGAFLRGAGVRVPQMLRHELEEGRIWMEDLGETDLWAYRDAPWEVRRGLYVASLAEAARLHAAASLVPSAEPALGLQPAFDARLYVWEQEYFFNQCLHGFFGVPQERLEPLRPALHALAERLEALPRTLVHRDFQSQNIIISRGAPCLIDFQGMRFGLPQYDLASLLLDPYVHLADAERAELLNAYPALAEKAGMQVRDDFAAVYDLCAAQRLMQALGAYGFLGKEKGRTEFLAHIPVALPRLLAVLQRIPGLEPLARLTEEVLEHSKSSPTGE